MDSDLPHEQSPSVRTYKGWVPVVSGYLSFTVIGDTSHPRQTVNANVADNLSRYIVCYQSRPASDAAFPLIATVLPRRRSSDERGIYRERDLWFLCVAQCNKTSEARALTGQVFVFPDAVWQRAMIHVRSAQSRLRALDNAGNGWLDAAFRTEHERLLEICQDYAVAAGAFRLERNGEFLLTLAESDRVGKPVRVEFDFSAQDRISIESRIRQSIENMYEDLAAQLYYFIRDLVHRHQHHDAESDQLTTIYPFRCNGLIKDRYTWLRHTYYQLMRQIINWKRLQGDDDLAAAAGVLCYARSLTKIAEAECQRQIKTKTLDEEEAKKAILIPTYSDENLEKSIRAKSESNRFKIQLGMSKTSWRTAIAALIIAILVANISIVNMAKGGTGYITASLYHEFASWLASHPIHVNIVVFIFVYYVIAGSRTPSQQVRVEKGVMRLVMALPNIHAARITVFLIGAGLLAGAVYAAHMLRDWTTVIRSIIG